MRGYLLILIFFSLQLQAQGYSVKEQLGFGDPKKEIPRMVNELNSELLVIGTHGHTGLTDIVYG